MAHGLVDPAVGVRSVVTGVVNDGALEMQRQEPRAQQHRQGPSTHKPAPDGQGCKDISTNEQSHRWIQCGRGVNELPRYRAVPRPNRIEQLILLAALNRPEVRQRF